MGRRILIYLIIWAAVLVLLCIISLIKYKDVLAAGLENTFSGLFVGVLIIASIGVAIIWSIRR